VSGLLAVIEPLDRCLIIEDNFLIRLDLEDMVQTLGFKHVDQADSMPHAMSLMETTGYRIAFVDLNLGHDAWSQAVKALEQHKIPFVLTTAFYDPNDLPDELKNAVFLPKPYSFESVKKILMEL
jgi:two-component SAPR family response regulator